MCVGIADLKQIFFIFKNWNSEAEGEKVSKNYEIKSICAWSYPD